MWNEPLNKDTSGTGPSDCMEDVVPTNGRHVPIMPRAAKVCSAVQPPLSSGRVPDVTDLCTPSPSDDSAFAPPHPKKIRAVHSTTGNGKKNLPETQSSDPMDITDVGRESGVEEVEPNGTVAIILQKAQDPILSPPMHLPVADALLLKRKIRLELTDGVVGVVAEHVGVELDALEQRFKLIWPAKRWRWSCRSACSSWNPRTRSLATILI